MQLYKLTQAYQEFMDSLDGLPPETIADTLEAITGEFDQKVDSIACIIKQKKAYKQAIDNEIDSLQSRKKTTENEIDSLQSYLMLQMLAVGKTKVETARNVVAVVKNQPSVVLDDGFIAWAEHHAESLLAAPKSREADKKAIKKAIQSGEVVEHARLVEGQALRIK